MAAGKSGGSGINVAALAKANQPLAGLRVTRVYPRISGRTIGIEAGDLITALDGQQVWQGFPRDSQRMQIMSFVSKDGKTHDVQINPGKIGIAERRSSGSRNSSICVAHSTV